MTNRKLCGKIGRMDTLKKKKLNLLLVALLAVCAIFAFSSAIFSADASTSVGSIAVNPKTTLEYYALNNPQDAYIGEDYSAIIQNDTSLLIYDSVNGFRESGASFSALKQVKKWGNNGLILTNQAALCTINLDSPDVLNPLPAYASIPMNANNFDLNENYLVTVYGGKGFIFKLDGTEINGVAETKPVNSVKQPITINPKNEIFYVSDAGKLCKCDASDPKNTAVQLGDFAPDMMIASTDYVYYVLSGEIFRLSVDGGESEKLTVITDQDFDLGKISSPSSISFYNDNLLIIDSTLNAIQEFKVVTFNDNGENKCGLQFTGFAIAKHQTAFNRPDTTPIDVEVYGNTSAILTDTQLFISKLDDTTYARENYKRFVFGSTELDSFDADKFALGNDTALLVNSTTKLARLLNLSDGTISEEINFDCTIFSDVCYQSGTYYALTLEFVNVSDTYNAHVYTYTEGNEFAMEKAFTFTEYCDEKSRMTVDVFGNVILSAKQNKVFRFDFDGETYHKVELDNLTTNGVVKMTTDLMGNLFIMSATNVLFYDGNSTTEYTISLTENGNSITPIAMAMNFDNDSVYFVGQNCELLFSTNQLPNCSVKSVDVPNEFVLSDTNADISNVKLYNVKTHANVYAVTQNELAFDYKGLSTHSETEEYLFVCDAEVSNGYSLAVLIGVKEGKYSVVLANEKDLILSSNAPVDTEEDSVYIATDVNAYYLPVFSLENNFVLTDGANTVRLKYGEQIKTLSTVTVFNKTFYYAEITVDENQVNAFVPFDFTTKQLSTEENRVQFTLKKVKATTVYTDATLSTTVKQLEENTVVRYYSEENGVAKIAFKDGNEWIEGYINSQDIMTQKSTALRNTLIIIAIALAICGTSTYFILKRKNK